MKVAIAQIAPVFLDRAKTTEKIVARIEAAAAEGATLVVFGETILPAYPVWLCRTDGAKFDDPLQKSLHELYLDAAIDIAEGHLATICDAAREHEISVIVGVAERGSDRGGYTIYCSRVFIDGSGEILSVHRKLMPTYEERLSWGTGDGAGLVTHKVGEFTVGALNCWENWMPLARAALYAEGEDLHVMLWPGCQRLTQDITRFVAKESRSFVVSVSGLIREEDFPADLPHRDIIAPAGETLYDGGSCVASPTGEWIVEPVVGREELIVVDLDPRIVKQERQNFDASGHYARPDVFQLTVDRRSQRNVEFLDD